MQAYCGLKALSRLFPQAHVEIIDYRPGRLRWTEYRKLLGRRAPFFKLATFRKILSIQRFVNEHLAVSPERCETDNLRKATSFINSQDYDVIFVGSDTVWEARKSSYVPLAPNVYYLPEVEGPLKVAYAASADPKQPVFIESEKTISAVSAAIKSFDLITVRDQATREYLEMLGLPAEEIHFIPDPTFQYDFSSLVQHPRVDKVRPWAAVGFNGAASVGIAKQLREKGFDIVNLSKWTLNEKPIPGAEASLHVRLGVFSMLDFMVTDRFHSSIFTMKLARAPMLVFVESAQKWRNMDSKGRDLFTRLGMERMVWRYEGGNAPDDLVERYMCIWDQVGGVLKNNLATLERLALRQLEWVSEQVSLNIQSHKVADHSNLFSSANGGVQNV